MSSVRRLMRILGTDEDKIQEGFHQRAADRHGRRSAKYMNRAQSVQNSIGKSHPLYAIYKGLAQDYQNLSESHKVARDYHWRQQMMRRKK